MPGLIGHSTIRQKFLRDKRADRYQAEVTGKMKQAYAYFKMRIILSWNVTIGCIVTMWNWLLGKPERLTALSTFAIFLATAAAACIGLAQWRALILADKTTRESFTSVQRAFVGISDLRIEKAHVFGTDGWLITPIIKNSGNTQARWLRRLAIEACLGGGVIMGGTESNCSSMERRQTGPMDPEDSFQTPLAKIRSLPILPQTAIPAGAAFITPARIKQMADGGARGYL